jgi:iron complex outermembrane receptor protein
VRGLDNYRVRIQENGLAVSDVSDLSEDHGVPVDPLSARRIEVIRGPATLRFGSQAIGGVVEVDNDRIPSAIPPRGFAGEINGAFNSVDGGLDGSVLIDAGTGNVAFHADAFGRRAGDYRIPSYPYLFPPDPAPAVGNRQPNTALRADGQSVGGSYVFDGGFAGIAVSRFASFYRIPGVEAAETNTRIDLEQTKVTGKGEFRPQGSAVDAVRYWAGATDYRHHELANEGGFDGIQQTFTNRAQEGRVEVQFTPFDLRFATLTPAVGVQGARQKLDAPGVSGGLLDPNETRSVAGYIFNELRFNDTLRAQIAGRVERVEVDGIATLFPGDFLPAVDGNGDFVAPRTARTRPGFTPMSASVGLLKDLPLGLVASATAQYVERAPRAPELLSRGPHEATGTFEIGNPNLKIEAARSFEIGLRRAQGPFRFEATGFYTRYAGFIFKRFTGTLCGDAFDTCGVEDELRQIVYAQRDAIFRGAEFQGQLDLIPVAGGMFGVDGQYDIVRATFTDGTNVPRIPPPRIGGGVHWRDPNWFARVGLIHAMAQNDLAENETPTAGYNLLKAVISYTRRLKPDPAGFMEITLGLVGDNLLDDDIRNAVSFKKDEVLHPGRTARGFMSVRF